MFAGNFAPVDWHYCDGSLLPISEYETLFQLIGTTYGGDGETTFAVPDLRGRLPLHMGTGGGATYIIGETGGAEAITLTSQQIPSHRHTLTGTSASANTRNPKAAFFATPRRASAYATIPGGGGNAMHAQAVGLSNGGSQPHNNLQPALCVSFIISLYGIFPSPT